MANLLFASRESDSLQSEKPGMSQPSRGLVLARGGWLGPPIEVCPEAELISSEDPATVCDRAFQIGKGLEVLVGERLIQNGPEVLGGLKLGRVRGQVGEPDPIRHSQVRRGVPAGAVEPEHDDA